MASLVRPPSTVRPQNNARRHHPTILSRDALLKNHHMTILSRDALWQHNPGRMAHCARPSSDDRHIPSPGEDKKTVNNWTASGVSTLTGSGNYVW